MTKQINHCVNGVTKKIEKVPICVGGVVREAKKGVCGVNGVVREFYRNALTILELYDEGYVEKAVAPYHCAGENSAGSCTWYNLDTYTTFSENMIERDSIMMTCRYENGYYDEANIKPRGVFLFCETEEGAKIVAESIAELYTKLIITNTDGNSGIVTIQSVTSLGTAATSKLSVVYGVALTDSSSGYREWTAYNSTGYKDMYVVHVATKSQLFANSSSAGKRKYLESIEFV